MNITTRIRKIEGQVFSKRTKKMKIVIVKEINGKFYIDGCGKLEETVLPGNDTDMNYVILKSYLQKPLEL